MFERLPERHPIVWAYLFFLFFSLPYQVAIYATGMSGTVGIRQALIMSALWLIPVVLMPSKVKVMTLLIGIVLWAAGLVAVGYFLVYGQDFSQSVIFIVFESNLSEGAEFIQSYLTPGYLVVFGLFTVIPVWMWRRMQPAVLTIPSRIRYCIFLAVLVSWPFTGYLLKGHSLEDARYHQVVRMEPAAPWNLAFGYVKYRQQLTTMNELLASNRALEPLKDLRETRPDIPKTFVLVIGESTNSSRMGIYGYSRDTTPRLNALNDELLVFSDVITARPYTIEALQQVLSFADQKDPERFFTEPTLINVMQQAGYQVTWITNQQTQTKRNTMLTTLSQMADRQVYLNNNRAQNAEAHDGAVLQPFAEALKSSTAKKMIVVHLLGTHRKYNYRYPEEFEHFAGTEHMPDWLDSTQADEYNSYDNAVRYNDFVIAEIIHLLENVGEPAVMAYLSDHGEEVYDTARNPFSGRNEEAPSPAMYTVPLIVWKNARYDRELNSAALNWPRYANRPFQTSDFIYLWFDLVGLSFNGLDNTRSVLSERFVASPRLIGNPHGGRPLLNYDSRFPGSGRLHISASP
ncbi:MAG: hypothetical protein CMN85_16375 [Spongiibacteraceae bacterium]|nr:hypothetical protein [Spongiibacteraceae bacterium]